MSLSGLLVELVLTAIKASFDVVDRPGEAREEREWLLCLDDRPPGIEIARRPCGAASVLHDFALSRDQRFSRAMVEALLEAAEGSDEDWHRVTQRYREDLLKLSADEWEVFASFAGLPAEEGSTLRDWLLELERHGRAGNLLVVEKTPILAAWAFSELGVDPALAREELSEAWDSGRGYMFWKHRGGLTSLLHEPLKVTEEGA